MKLFLVATLLALSFGAATAIAPVAGATPIHPTACTSLANSQCAGWVCVSGDASARPICWLGPEAYCLEFYNRVTVGPATVTYGGCNAPSVHVDTSILA